jgi:hypothetical protein
MLQADKSASTTRWPRRANSASHSAQSLPLQPDLMRSGSRSSEATGKHAAVFRSGMAACCGSWWQAVGSVGGLGGRHRNGRVDVGTVQPHVAAETRTLAYDRAGLGGSDADSRPWSLERLADDLDLLLHEVEPEAPGAGRSIASAATRPRWHSWLLLFGRAAELRPSFSADLTRHDAAVQLAAAANELPARSTFCQLLRRRDCLRVHEVLRSGTGRDYRLNLLVPLWLIQSLLPGMLARGTGRVVNICSLASRGPLPYGRALRCGQMGLGRGDAQPAPRVRRQRGRLLGCHPGVRALRRVGSGANGRAAVAG